MINLILKFTTIFFLGAYSIFCQGQLQNHFIGGVFFNANGIHVEGENNNFWQNSGGTIWGGGGLSTGLYVKRYLHKKTYLDLEIRYIQKGSVYDYINQYSAQSHKVLRLNYLELPVLIGYMLKTNKNKYFIESGIACARLFSSKLNILDFVNSSGYINAEDFKDYDLSWISTFKFPLNKKKQTQTSFWYSFLIFDSINT